MHYSEMNFLFNEPTKTVTTALNNTTQNNSRSLFWRSKVWKSDKNLSNGGSMVANVNEYVVYKQNPDKLKENTQMGSTNVKNFIRDKIYSETGQNPYIRLVNEFQSSPGLRIKPSDLAYLRDLGVYPINRMVILRRFPAGNFLPSDLTTIQVEPISTIIGWIKPEESFGDISFNEQWDVTNNRFDMLLREIIAGKTGGATNMDAIVPVPGFAQGFLFELFNQSGLVGGEDSPWNSENIPVGDPDLLQEGPFRDPSKQNLKSDFAFKFETSYEQKLIGETDPGAAMLDLIDNILTMGTSNMKYYWNDQSDVILEAKRAASKGANSASEWWDFIKTLLGAFVDGLTNMMKGVQKKLQDTKEIASSTGITNGQKMTDFLDPEKGPLAGFMRSILTSTIAKYRWEMRGTIELMTGGADSSTPWYLTIGNPYSPWIATNHIIVTRISISTSPELGFQDQPMWIKASIDCQLSRSLGKQEIMKMFNNTFIRRYSKKTNLFVSQNTQNQNNQTPQTVNQNEFLPGINQNFGLDVTQLQRPKIQTLENIGIPASGNILPDTINNPTGIKGTNLG